MTSIGIILGSTRPGRNGEAVAHWVRDQAIAHGHTDVEIVDLHDFGLPHLDEPSPAAAGVYTQPHTRQWSDKVAGFDAFVFVTPEYNRSMPGVLKTAVDFLFDEWANKAAAFVSYGVHGGVRAVEHLRSVLGQLRVASVTSQVSFSIFTDFAEMTRFTPGDHHEVAAKAMFDELVSWAEALKTLRV
ncbi:MAG TPA: NAD(P)H-dependent oxidoreductase [Jiangellaceae bacterium]